VVASDADVEARAGAEAPISCPCSGLIARWNTNQGKGWCAGFYVSFSMRANGEVGSDPRVGVVF
jgi:hypothetical protein